MDFNTNVKNMFRMEETKEQRVISDTVETINDIEMIKEFFNSRQGKLFLSWFDEVKTDLYEQLESCSSEDLVKIQANIKAVKLLTTVLNDKFEELVDLKEKVQEFIR